MSQKPRRIFERSRLSKSLVVDPCLDPLILIPRSQSYIERVDLRFPGSASSDQ